jgi:hypothetical protein
MGRARCTSASQWGNWSTQELLSFRFQPALAWSADRVARRSILESGDEVIRDQSDGSKEELLFDAEPFAERGYRETTINDIAERADVNQGRKRAAGTRHPRLHHGDVPARAPGHASRGGKDVRRAARPTFGFWPDSSRRPILPVPPGGTTGGTQIGVPLAIL